MFIAVCLSVRQQILQHSQLEIEHNIMYVCMYVCIPYSGYFSRGANFRGIRCWLVSRMVAHRGHPRRTSLPTSRKEC